MHQIIEIHRSQTVVDILPKNSIIDLLSDVMTLYPNFSFPVFSLITHKEMNILSFDIYVNKGKQKTPSGTPCGVFCFPWGKQKSPGALL